MLIDQLKDELLTKPSYFKESYRTIASRFGVPVDMVYEAFRDPAVNSAKKSYNFKSYRQPPINQGPIDEVAVLRTELDKLRRQFNAIRQDPKALELKVRRAPDPFIGGDPRNVLVIGDSHIPFERQGYLEFCREQQEKFNCGTVVHIGDVVDQHFSSYHESNPDGFSAGDELALSIDRLKLWRHTFPDVKVCFGNHDLLIQRQAYSAGLSNKWIKGFNEVLELPGWDFDMEHLIEDVIYTHGTGTSGENGAFQKALNRRKSVVSGHLHTIANVKWNVSEADRIFAMQVGCVDKDTEFLSPTGWKSIGDYDKELVGQYNDDGTVTFVQPLKYIKAPAISLNKIKTNYGISQVFCDDHTVVYKNRSNRLCKVSGSTFVDRHQSNVNGFDGKFIVAYDIKNNSSLPLSDAQIRVQVAVHADGSFSTRNELNTCTITVKKLRKVERLKKLLEDAGIEYNYREYKNATHRFTFQAPVRSKTFNNSWYQASNNQLKIITEECLLWDGNQKNQYYSNHKTDADFIQYAFVSTKRRSSISIDSRPNKVSYRVTASNKTENSVNSKSKKIENIPTKDGYKYCFTVPSHMLVLRNNNCVFITGNCGIDDKAYAFEYARGIVKKSIISCGVVLGGQLPIIIPMSL